MSTNGKGRIELLGHQKPQPTKAQVELAALERVATNAARAAVIPVIEHYMAQVPGLVATMIGQVLAANGLTMQPPPEWEEMAAVAPVVSENTGEDTDASDTKEPAP